MRGRRRTLAATIAAAVVGGSLLVSGAQTAQAASYCTHKVGYEVDGQRRAVLLSPRVTCTTAIRAIRIYSFTPRTGEKSTYYENRAAGTYSGIGLYIPRNAADEYCMVVRSEWVTAHGVQGLESTRHCVRL